MNQAKVEIENQVIGLDLPEIVTDNWSIIRSEMLGKLRTGWIRQFDYFCDSITKDDFIVVLDGIFSILGIARTEKANHRYDKKLSQSKAFFDHVRDVEWISAFDFNSSKRLEKPLYGFSNTITIVRNNSPRWPILTELVI